MSKNERSKRQWVKPEVRRMELKEVIEVLRAKADARDVAAFERAAAAVRDPLENDRTRLREFSSRQSRSNGGVRAK